MKAVLIIVLSLASIHASSTQDNENQPKTIPLFSIDTPDTIRSPGCLTGQQREDVLSEFKTTIAGKLSLAAHELHAEETCGLG